MSLSTQVQRRPTPLPDEPASSLVLRRRPTPHPNELAIGDRLDLVLNLYPGSHSHHASNWTAGASVNSTITAASKNAQEGSCVSVVVIGGSLLESVGSQNVEANAQIYPITEGSGKYAGDHGAVVVKAVGKRGDVDLTITVRSY